jgi:hypothetical protein
MRPKLEPRSSLTIITLVLMIFSLGIGQAAPKATLETLCDKVGILQTRYAPASFEESSALLESTIRQALLNSEIPQAEAVRLRLTLKSAVSPPGSLPFSVSTPALTCSIRELVRQFAATWKIAATISGDQILFQRLPPNQPQFRDRGRVK